jgi:hypothetical protein
LVLGTVAFNISGTIIGGLLRFEGTQDSGTTWVPIAGSTVNGSFPDTDTGLNPYSGSGQVFRLNTSGLTGFRVRLQEVITSTGTLNLSCDGLGLGTPDIGPIQPIHHTYVAFVNGIASGANKDYFNIQNCGPTAGCATISGKILKIWSIEASMDSAAAVTGLQPGFTMSRFTTAPATCTGGTISQYDTRYNATAGIVVTSNCTISIKVNYTW